MVSYRTIKCVNNVRSYSSFQNYKVHGNGKLQKYTMHELSKTFFSPAEPTKVMERVSNSSLQNYKMREYGKRYSYRMYE